jgi:hypothetical protein
MNIKPLTYHVSILIMIVILLFITGCSRGNSVLPDEVTDQNLPAISDAGTTGTGSERSLLGIWQMEFDVESMTAKVEPIRSAEFHFNVVSYIDPPTVHFRSWNPVDKIIDVDVDIHNTSIVTAYDVRLIIFRDTIGHKLLNPDNYTHLWDIPEGTWSNGFKAYGKSHTNRYFHSQATETENFQIRCPNANFNVKFAIDASWPLNCSEPYLMNNFTQGKLPGYAGASAVISIDIYDWQNDVESVRIQCGLITGQTDVYFNPGSGLTWHLNLINNTGAPEGDYLALIAAGSANTDDQLIDLVTIHVSKPDEGFARSWDSHLRDVYDDGKKIAINSNNETYVAGIYQFWFLDQAWGDFFISKFSRQGDRNWLHSIDCTGSLGVTGIAIDNQERVVFTAYRSPVTDPYTYTQYLYVYNPDGEIYLSRSWSGNANCIIIKGVRIDENGNSKLFGYSEGLVDFDPDPIATDYYDSYRNDGIVITLDNQFNYVSTYTWKMDGFISDLSFDSSDNLLLCGGFRGDYDFDPSDEAYWLHSNGEYDCFLIKLDSTMDFLWGRSWGGSSNDVAYTCAVDEFADIYVGGYFQETVDFNPDPREVEEREAISYRDGFYSKFDNSGDFQWVGTHSASFNESVTQIVPDSDESVYLVCESQISFLQKITLDNEFQWKREWNFNVRNISITSNYLCLTGGFQGTQDFDPGPGEYFLTSGEASDAYMMKLLPNGYWE